MSMHDAPPVVGIVLDDDARLNHAEFCVACGIAPALLSELVAGGVLEPRDVHGEWRFAPPDLRRARLALRLARDFELDAPALALAVDLCEEVERLRRRLRALERVMSG